MIDVRLWFSWCVCATCLPAYPWANRAVTRFSSDCAPTSCRAFLVRTLLSSRYCYLHNNTNRWMLHRKDSAYSLICSYGAIPTLLAVFGRGSTWSPPSPKDRKRWKRDVRGGGRGEGGTPPQKGQNAGFWWCFWEVEKTSIFTPHF